MKKFIIRDYNDCPVETDVDLDNLEDILRMKMLVLTGDEILTVTHKDGTTERYDSSNCRRINYYDGEYVFFDAENGINLIDEDYLSMENSYDRMDHVGAPQNLNIFDVYAGDEES